MKFGWKTITGIITVIGGISGLIIAWGTIKSNIIYPFLDDWNKERKGGFRIEIAKGLDKEPDDISPYLIDIIRNYENTVRIGPVKYLDDEDNLYYIDIDGKKYTAFVNEHGEWFAWDNNIEGNNKWRPVN